MQLCELLGLCFEGPVKANISLDVFQRHGTENPDGWGVAYYNQNLLQVIKEPRPAIGSSLFDFAENHIKSPIIISHVRRTSVGSVNYFNTHPFCRQVRIGNDTQEWTLAHNGTLSGYDQLRCKRYQPLGETDSERLFCHILDYILDNEIEFWRSSDFNELNVFLREINENYGSMNCMFSNGLYLFCYSDINSHNDGLRFVHRKHPFGKIELITKNASRGSVTIRTVDLGAIKNESGYLIVTEELTNEHWQNFKNGRLMVFSYGQLIHH